MTRLAQLTRLKVLQGVREKLFWGVGLLFLLFLALAAFLSVLSVGEGERVLRGVGLAAIEVSGLILLLSSVSFGFHRDRLSRMTEVYLASLPHHVYTASLLCAALVLALGYLLLAGACWSAVLVANQAFVWPVVAGLASLFLKLALAISVNLLFCCVLSSPALALLSTLFIYLAGALAPQALQILVQQGQRHALIELFRWVCYLLPNVSQLDIAAQLVAGQLPGPAFFPVMSGYTVAYGLFLWSLSSWALAKRE